MPLKTVTINMKTIGMNKKYIQKHNKKVPRNRNHNMLEERKSLASKTALNTGSPTAPRLKFHRESFIF